MANPVPNVVQEMTFSKSWLRAEDFPTYEPNEGQVRADLQALHDEVKDYLNNTVLPILQRAAYATPYEMATADGAFLRLRGQGGATWEALTDVSEVGA